MNRPAPLTIVAFLLLLASFVACWHYILYGSLTRDCVYTEELLPVPEQLIDGEIVVFKRAYLAFGNNKDYSCLKILGNIDREIVSPEAISNITIGRRYFTDKGLTVKPLKIGSRFSIADIVAVTKHGITTIDSGPGPIYHLILKGQNDVLYQIATVSLGLNKRDLFLSYVDPTQTSNATGIQFLSPNSFDGTIHHEGRNSIAYTGELTEVSKAYLEKNKTYLDKLSERLARGEKFTISVEIELRDDHFKKIVLSENPKERYKQISQIQSEFLKKIPSNIGLDGVEKNPHHPYVYMEANLELLNYLRDQQTALQVKTVSELVRSD